MYNSFSKNDSEQLNKNWPYKPTHLLLRSSNSLCIVILCSLSCRICCWYASEDKQQHKHRDFLYLRLTKLHPLQYQNLRFPYENKNSIKFADESNIKLRLFSIPSFELTLNVCDSLTLGKNLLCWCFSAHGVPVEVILHLFLPIRRDLSFFVPQALNWTQPRSLLGKMSKILGTRYLCDDIMSNKILTSWRSI